MKELFSKIKSFYDAYKIYIFIVGLLGLSAGTQMYNATDTLPKEAKETTYISPKEPVHDHPEYINNDHQEIMDKHLKEWHGVD